LAGSLANIKKITTNTNAYVVKKNKPEETKKVSAQQTLDIKNMINLAKQKAQNTKSLLNENRHEGLYPVGTRVFHINFGVGKIVNIEDNSYVVEFTKHGTKTLDSKTSGLKMF